MLVPPFSIGKIPVTPVVKGNPVAFVKTPDAGVPSAGVTNVGLLDKTVLPVPVDVETPVPPCETPIIPETPVPTRNPDEDGNVSVTVFDVSGPVISTAPPSADCKISFPMIFLWSNN